MKGLIFTYLLTYGGAVMALFNPFYGLLIYFIFAICNPRAMWWWSVPAGNYSRTIAIALLVGWAWQHSFGDWQFRRARPLVLLLLCYLGWRALSASTAVYQVEAWRSVEILAKIVLPFMVGMTLIDSIDKVVKVAWVLTLSSGYVAYELNVKYYDGLWAGRGNVIVGTDFAGLDNNGIAMMMATAAPVALFLGMYEKVAWRKWLCFVLATLIGHVPMIADSRGGMLALIVMGTITFFMVATQPRHYFAFLLAVIVGWQLAGAPVVQRFSTIFVEEEQRDSSANARLKLWGQMWDASTRNPLLGIGPDNWEHYSVSDYGWPKPKAGHNTWLQACAEVGLVGAAFLMGFYGLTVWKMWTVVRPWQDVDPWYGHCARMVIISLAGFGVAGTFVTSESVELPYYVVLLGAATLKLVPEHAPLAVGSQATGQPHGDYAYSMVGGESQPT